MTTLLGSRRRAEELAAMVDGTRVPLRDVSTGSTAPPELSALVGVVQTLRREAVADEAATPRAAFAAALREQLLTEAATALAPRRTTLTLPTRTRTRRERRLVAAASVAVLLGGSAGMVVAAEGSLPGEALYPVKRGIESARVQLSGSAAGQGRDLLAQASDRLTEAQALLEAGPPTGSPQLPGTIEDFTSQARRGSDLLLGSYAEGRDPATIVTLRSFTARDLDTLEALSRTAPAAAQPALQEAMTVLGSIDARASQACPTCSGLAPLATPTAFRASQEAERAMRALDPAQLSNDHPYVADRAAVRRATQHAPSAGAAPHAKATPTAPSTPLSRAPDGGGVLPDLSDGTPAGKTKVEVKAKVPSLGTKSGGGSATPGGDLGAGLGGAVETLLPDPDVQVTPKLP